MQIHQLKRKTANKKSRQVGRGGKRGKTAGRGTKGQKARAGRKIRPEIRDTIKKLPKLRGYAFNVIGPKPVTVSITAVEKKFDNGAVVNVASLVEARLVSLQSGKAPAVKIVGGKGDVSVGKKLSIEGVAVSSSVKEALEKVGGTVK